jgi:hypothetical protein
MTDPQRWEALKRWLESQADPQTIDPQKRATSLARIHQAERVLAMMDQLEIE